MNIRVGIVDDHEIVRAGLRLFLEEQDDLEVVAEASNGKDALDVVRNEQIDVLLLDLTMPRFSGLEALPSLKARAPHTAILVFSGLPEEQYAVNLIRKGADGYLHKENPPLEILNAVRVVAQGRRYLSPVVANLLAEEMLYPTGGSPHNLLADREFQIFLRLAKGESITTVGRALSLSVKTVTTYRTRAMRKLKLSTNSDLTYYAVKHGLIE